MPFVLVVRDTTCMNFRLEKQVVTLARSSSAVNALHARLSLL